MFLATIERERENLLVRSFEWFGPESGTDAPFCIQMGKASLHMLDICDRCIESDSHSFTYVFDLLGS